MPRKADADSGAPGIDVNELCENSAFLKMIEKIVQRISENSNAKLEAAMERSERKLSELIERNVSTLHDIQVTIDNKFAELQQLQTKIDAHEEKISGMTASLNNLEQYSRRNNIRVLGIAEKDGENTDEVVCELAQQIGVQLSPRDIDRSHRIGKPPGQQKRYVDALRSNTSRSDPPRPIIVKFTSYKPKQVLIKERRKLKGTRTIIVEDLTATNAKLLTAAHKHTKTCHTWSVDGRIFVTVKDSNNMERKRLISCHSDLRNI